jgi:hypothetical protein
MAGQSTAGPDAVPVERVRNDVRVRSLAVMHVEHVTPAMMRMTFSGEDLADFNNRGSTITSNCCCRSLRDRSNGATTRPGGSIRSLAPW